MLELNGNYEIELKLAQIQSLDLTFYPVLLPMKNPFNCSHTICINYNDFTIDGDFTNQIPEPILSLFKECTILIEDQYLDDNG